MAASVVHVYPARAARAHPVRHESRQDMTERETTRTMTRIRTIGLAGVLALMVAACSGGPASSPSATSASTSSAPSVAASQSAAATESQVALPTFELPSNAKDLEALLPDKIGDVTMQKTSQTGEDFVSDDIQTNQEFTDFLNHLGAQLDDVSVATAIPDFQANPELAADPTAYSIIFAFRVAGADSAKLESEMKTAMAADASEAVTWSPQNVGGKDVQVAKIVTDSEVNESTYLYTVQDIVFAVISGSADNAAEALGKLP